MVTDATGQALKTCGRRAFTEIRCVLNAGHVCLTLWFGGEDYLLSSSFTTGCEGQILSLPAEQ